MLWLLAFSLSGPCFVVKYTIYKYTHPKPVAFLNLLSMYKKKLYCKFLSQSREILIFLVNMCMVVSDL